LVLGSLKLAATEPVRRMASRRKGYFRRERKILMRPPAPTWHPAARPKKGRFCESRDAKTMLTPLSMNAAWSLLS
jgi:hypothetical protein